jgi:uncharacterized membrane protein
VKSWTIVALWSAVCLVTACKSDSEDLPEVNCNEGTVPTYAEIKTAALAKCTTCHSSQLTGSARVDAPADINFDTFAAAKADAKQAGIEVNEGAMPPAGSPAPSASEKDALYKWAQCGTPE